MSQQTAFDSDILSDLFDDVPAVVARVTAVPVAEQALPVTVVEEALRGRLDAIRKAQAANSRQSAVQAYELFAETLADLSRFPVLAYTTAADALFRAWRAAGIRVGSQDLRIGAICVAHGAKLATRNARDFRQVPGLQLDIWP